MIGGDILGERTRLTPDRIALVYVPTGERLRYRQLDERATRCARMWAEACQLARGERIGILAQNSVEFIEAFAAAGKSGHVLVPLNTRYTAHELEAIVRDSGLRALHYGEEFSETVRALRKAVAIPHGIALGAPAEPGDLTYAEAMQRCPASNGQPQPCPPESLYVLFYTSGTTGKPKGVRIPHRMVAWNAYNTAISWQLRDDDVSPIFTPLHHAGGLTVFLTPVWAIGGTIVLHRGFDPAEIWRTIEKERCTVVLGVPTIFQILLNAPECPASELKHVRWFISGGAPLPPSLVEAYRRRGIVLKQGYGLTEVGVNCFAMTAEEAVRKAGSIGKPLMFTEARVVDRHGREAGVGEVGELLLRGPHVCQGYWNDPEATAASLDTDGWFHTGDLARRDEEGFYYIAGRLKDLFISGGANVHPAEVEEALRQHPGVEDAAVIGVPDPKWGEAGVAFIVARRGAPVEADDLAGFLAKRLAKYKVPREFIRVEALPRSAYGKVQKAELRTKYDARQAPVEAAARAGTKKRSEPS